MNYIPRATQSARTRSAAAFFKLKKNCACLGTGIALSAALIASDTQAQILRAAGDKLAIVGQSRISAGVCSLPYTINRTSALLRPLPSSTNLSFQLSKTGAGPFYADSKCTTEVRSVDMAAGSATSRAFYLREDVQGGAKLSATTSAAPLAPFSVTVTTPTRVVIETAGVTSTLPPLLPLSIGIAPRQTMIAGECTARRVGLRDLSSSEPLQAASALKVQLSATGPVNVFKDAGCSQPAQEVSIAAGETHALFYVRAHLPERVVLYATPPTPLAMARRIELVGAAPNAGIAGITLKGPEIVPTAECSKAFTAMLLNAQGIAQPAQSPIALTLQGQSPDLLYSDAACTVAVSSIAIPSGASQASFHLKSVGGELHTLSARLASSPGATSNTLRYRSCTPGSWGRWGDDKQYRAGLGLREPPVEMVYGYTQEIAGVINASLPTCPYFSGDIRVPVLLVDWADFNPATDISNPNNPDSKYSWGTYRRRTPAEIEAFLNGPQGIGQFIKDTSGGWTRVTFDIVSWINSDEPQSYLKNRSDYIRYDDYYAKYQCDRDAIFQDALRDAIAYKGLDINRYDNDNNGVIDGAVLLYEGDSGLCSGGNLSLLSSGVILTNPPAFTYPTIESLVPNSDPNYAKFAGLTKFLGLYNNMPEMTFVPENYHGSRTWVHELGHLFLGYPDYYYSQFNMGAFAMSAAAPGLSHFAAWEKWLYGLYIEPQEVKASGTYTLRANEVPDGDNYASGTHLLKIGLDADPRTFLTIENRWFSEAGNTKSSWAKGYERESGLQIVEFNLSKDVFASDPAQVYRHVPARGAGTYSGNLAFKPGDEFQKCYATQCVQIRALDAAQQDVRVEISISPR